jgi:predicted N-acetyltransferase YhbS
MKIEHLAEHVAAIPTLARWVHAEWGHLLPHETLETHILEFERRTKCHTIPQTFVALENDKVVGAASIIENDMSTRKEFSPWLAAVYVAPQFRNRGIGSKLVQAAMREAEALGVEKLYLFTPHRVSFYRRLGWKACERTEYRGDNVTVMSYEIKL